MKLCLWKMWLILMTLIGVGQPASADAHPLDVLLQDMRVQIQPTQITLTIHLIAGPLTTPRLWADLDADGSDTLESGEISAWCERFLAQVAVQFDADTRPLVLDQVGQFPTTRATFIGGGATNLEWSAIASLPTTIQAGDHDVRLFTNAYHDMSAADWSKTRGRAGIVVREAAVMTLTESHFPVVWPAVFKADSGVALPSSVATPVPTSAGGESLLARLRAGDGSLGVVLGTLLTALLFGALHALQPGHGKTLVAAYLVGSRGTVRQAVILGSIVTFTHTASVFGLGTLVLVFSAWINPQQIIPGLTVFSGGLVIVVGLRLLFNRARMARAATPAHNHGDGVLHQHTVAGSHDHQPTGSGLVALGISGGLVPCPEALVIMIVAATIGRIGLGLAMIVAFSIGLAAVLITLGLVLVTLRTQTWRISTRDHPLLRWLPVASAMLVVGLGAALVWQGLAQ